MSSSLPLHGDEEEEEGWEEEDETGQCFRCLLCSTTSPSLRISIQHMLQSHGFDLRSQLKDIGVSDDYEFIRLINFIRSEVNEGRDAIQGVGNKTWSKNDTYLTPFDPEDEYLTVDVDELCDSGNEGRGDVAEPLEERLKRTEDALDEAKHELNAMRRCMHRIVTDDVSDPPRVPNGPISASEDDDDEPAPPLVVSAPPVLIFPRSAQRSAPLTDSYFESYDRPSIHEEMLLDTVRTSGYLNFISGNAERIFAGRRVLDLGCGTGILSMAAAKAGAREVVAVDRSDIIFTAMDIARENGLHEKISFHHGRIEDIYHELGQIDVIISEWMGYFLLFESMLDSVLFCRERLNPSHGIFPRFYTLRLVGLDDPTLAKEKVECWDDFYGFRMSALRRQITHEACVRICPPTTVVTNSCELCAIDILSCGLDWQVMNSQIDLEIESQTATRVTAIAGYFDTLFESLDQCDKQVDFSTGPAAAPTHWKQTVFVLQEPLSVKQGERLKGEISVKRSQTDMRSLTVELSLINSEGTRVQQRYTMD